MLKRLYDWMMEKAAHAHAERWLFLFSFVEIELLPDPAAPVARPDVPGAAGQGFALWRYLHLGVRAWRIVRLCHRLFRL